MLVEPHNFEACLAAIEKFDVLGVDCETTGKYWWRHKLFSIIISTPEEEYYFDFNGDRPTLPRSFISRLSPIIGGACLHGSNAKFDKHFLYNEQVNTNTHICSVVRERVIKNNRLPSEYNLDSNGKRYCGEGKDEAVEEYIYANKLYTQERIPGKKKIADNLQFYSVPLEITQPYGEKDARLHLGVGIAQEQKLIELDKLYPASNIYGSILDVDRNEQSLIQTCFKMEREGIKINVPYTTAAMEFESGEVNKLKNEFGIVTGLTYSDSRSCFKKAFDDLGLKYPLTEKGNPSFKEEVLELIDNPIANLIRDIRYYEKRIGTYYSSFLYFRDGNDVLHPSINQSGAQTGRMSHSDPNTANIPKEDSDEDFKKPFLVRGCFKPRETNNFFVAPDFRQMEFRMLLDYAGEHQLIKEINEGADPHQATADLTGLTRGQAKTFNFMILYGGGIEKIAWMLGISIPEAYKLREQYFGRMPGVKKFTRQVIAVAKTRGYVRNWFGRIIRCDDPNFAYAILNHLIQSGCADIVKIAMNQIHARIQNTSTKMLLQIHDELLFETDTIEFFPEIVKIMENVYEPQNNMFMQTSMKYSFISWAAKDMKEGLP